MCKLEFSDMEYPKSIKLSSTIFFTPNARFLLPARLPIFISFVTSLTLISLESCEYKAVVESAKNITNKIL